MVGGGAAAAADDPRPGGDQPRHAGRHLVGGLVVDHLEVDQHFSGLGGPGVRKWDLAFEPVWVDSASDWTLGVMGGWTPNEARTLPTSDVERLRAWIEGEWDRRDALD